MIKIKQSQAPGWKPGPEQLFTVFVRQMKPQASPVSVYGSPGWKAREKLHQRGREHVGLEARGAALRISQNGSCYGRISVSGSGLWNSDECERIWNRMDSSDQYFCLCRKSPVSGGYNACGSSASRYGSGDVSDAQCPPPVLRDFHAGKIWKFKTASPLSHLFSDR